ncbi:MAG: efflux RND transporter periplasmic adaptor subunit [Bacteroidia bacterium]|nr:efflux RND transporter periplasmic adaptor subunit [Bacteroidia bacterium]MCX7651560.1 efflux RND transporter periplasmic adaptor subunit [Bacteroidia bacterium]MDW8417264.1 efflux RND transporter periplasmic adaptor subunit [Bacteroidia bacterium]
MFSRLFIFSFSAVIFSGGCSSAPTSLPIEKSLSQDTLYLSPLQKQGAEVQVSPLRAEVVRERVRLIGRTMVLAHSQGRAHSRAEGTVESILVREGQFVQAGQELFRIYSASVIELQRQFLELYARWRAVQKRLALQEGLSAQRVISQMELLQSQAELQQLGVQIQSIHSQLRLLGLEPDTTGRIRLLSVRAPIAGYVTYIGASMGEYIRPEQPLAFIVNLSDIHADLHISERELAWLKEGMPVELRLPGLPQLSPLYSKVEYIAQVEDSTGRHLLAHVRVPPTPYPLFAGTPIEGFVEKELGRHFVVPREALGYHGGQVYVFAQEGDRYVPLVVQVSFIDSLALIEGKQLREGLPIVQRGAAFLASQLWQVGEE